MKNKIEVLKVENLNFEYENYSLFKKKTSRSVLSGINLSLKNGEILGLLGQSGSGKSTLAKIIIGILKAKEGNIFLNENKISLNSLSKRREFYKKVQIVFQDSVSSTNKSLKIYSIIEEPLLYLSSLDKNEREKRIYEVIDFVGLNKNILDKKAAFISGGELQRVCIARSLAIKPEILIFDEATSSVDLIKQIQILNLIKNLKSKFSMIFITHDIRLVNLLCDRVVLLDDGKIIEEVLVGGGLKFKSQIGKNLLNEVLPAMPK